MGFRDRLEKRREQGDEAQVRVFYVDDPEGFAEAFEEKYEAEYPPYPKAERGAVIAAFRKSIGRKLVGQIVIYGNGTIVQTGRVPSLDEPGDDAPSVDGEAEAI